MTHDGEERGFGLHAVWQWTLVLLDERIVEALDVSVGGVHEMVMEKVGLVVRCDDGLVHAVPIRWWRRGLRSREELF